MKNPAASSGVSEKHELPILMKLLINTALLHCPSIFRRKHHVIQQHRYIMTLMNILAHASTLRPKGRGINPVEIQQTPQADEFKQQLRDSLQRETLNSRAVKIARHANVYN